MKGRWKTYVNLKTNEGILAMKLPLCHFTLLSRRDDDKLGEQRRNNGWTRGCPDVQSPSDVVHASPGLPGAVELPHTPGQLVEVVWRCATCW